MCRVARRGLRGQREDLAGLAGHLLEQERAEGVDAGKVRLEVDGRAVVQDDPVKDRPARLRAQAAFIRIGPMKSRLPSGTPFERRMS